MQLFADFHNLSAASRYNLCCISELSQAHVPHGLTELPKILEEEWAAWRVLQVGTHQRDQLRCQKQPLAELLAPEGQG